MAIFAFSAPAPHQNPHKGTQIYIQLHHAFTQKARTQCVRLCMHKDAAASEHMLKRCVHAHTHSDSTERRSSF